MVWGDGETYYDAPPPEKGSSAPGITFGMRGSFTGRGNVRGLPPEGSEGPRGQGRGPDVPKIATPLPRPAPHKPPQAIPLNSAMSYATVRHVAPDHRAYPYFPPAKMHLEADRLGADFVTTLPDEALGPSAERVGERPLPNGAGFL